jgi:DNA-directed RNA polymerase specialized sigma subunit
MNTVTRNALVNVDHILSEAGWDKLEGDETDNLSNEQIGMLRSAYKDLLRGDHLAVLDRTLGKNQTLREAGEQMGLSERAVTQLLREALARVNAFAGVSSKA